MSRAIAQYLVTLAAGYPAVRLSEAQCAVYMDALSDLSPEQLNQACQRAIRECKFFPSVAELRMFVAPGTDDAAVLAWTALNRAARVVGAYQSLQCEDWCAAEALTQVFGGWAAFCQHDDGPAYGQKRTEFLVAYRNARRRPSASRWTVSLPGLCEAACRGLPGGARHWTGRLTADGRVMSSLPEINRLTEGE